MFAFILLSVHCIDLHPVVRFVDRDMVMRYYWGLGVGHVYSRCQASMRRATPWLRHNRGSGEVVTDNREGDLTDNESLTGSEISGAHIEDSDDALDPRLEDGDVDTCDEASSCEADSNDDYDSEIDGAYADDWEMMND
jgi:hypothetical protein